MYMSSKQARVIDPVLTTFAQGFRHVERVGSTLFPTIPVNVRGGTVLEFDRASFGLFNARRAPGAQTMNVSFGYAGKPFQLIQEALNAAVPREFMEDASAVPHLDLAQRAISITMQILTLALENQQAALAIDPVNYDDDHKLTLSAADQWSNPDSDPERTIADAKEAVRMTAGVDPNRMVIGKKVYNALKRHPKIIDRFKYTSSDSITTSMLASLFDLDVLAVGKAMVVNEPDGKSQDGMLPKKVQFHDIWGNLGVLAYAPNAPSGPEEPSFGYTYTLNGHPFVEKPEWDNDKKSWIYGVTYERLPVLTGIASGFLFQNLVGEDQLQNMVGEGQ